jgi:hypothetical protein
MTCPHCKAELSEAEIKALYAQLNASKRKTRGGWPKGKPRKQVKDPTCVLCDSGEEHEH